MAEVYLQIEKIRFEDKLRFATEVDEELNYYLGPRFVLQPLCNLCKVQVQDGPCRYLLP